MSKEKDINNGLQVGDIVKHAKRGIQGRIHDFEWSGVRRAAVETGESKAYYILSVEELELVYRPVEPRPITQMLKETHEEDRNKKRNSKED